MFTLVGSAMEAACELVLKIVSHFHEQWVFSTVPSRGYSELEQVGEEMIGKSCL
jgi:hypothetical protein